MIAFTQYLRPDGCAKAIEIGMPPPIEHLAFTFINAGGRYEAEVLRTGHISLTAVFEVAGEDQDIAIEICANNAAVVSAVEAVVRKSIAFLDHAAIAKAEGK
jgi:hypothetical protein